MEEKPDLNSLLCMSQESFIRGASIGHFVPTFVKTLIERLNELDIITPEVISGVNNLIKNSSLSVAQLLLRSIWDLNIGLEWRIKHYRDLALGLEKDPDIVRLLMITGIYEEIVHQGRKIFKNTLIVYQYPLALPDVYRWAADQRLVLCPSEIPKVYMCEKEISVFTSERFLITPTSSLKECNEILGFPRKVVLWGSFSKDELIILSLLAYGE